MTEEETGMTGALNDAAGPIIDAGAIDRLLRDAGCDLWGAARVAPEWGPLAPDLPTAVSLGMRLRPEALAGVENGPTPAYFAEYMRVNLALNEAAARLAAGLRAGGHAAAAVPALVVDRVEPIADWGEAGIFPHKTAATQAGLGWIGKTALLVTPAFGPRIRLATVFTDLELPADEPVVEGRCGACRRCVDACPASAGRDVTWSAGMTRDELYREKACEHQLEEFGDVGEVCGICIAVCPRGAART